MRIAKSGRKRTKTAISNITAGNRQVLCVIVINNNTGENRECTSIRKAARFVNIHHYYVAKCIKKL